MESVEGITDVSSNREPGGLQLSLKIDRQAASSLGVSAQSINNALYNAFAQRQISTIYTQRNQYRVVIEVDPDLQRDPSNLAHIYVSGANGVQVPLSAVVRYERDLSPLAVYHQGQFPTVTISFAAEEGVTLQTATQNILQAVAELHMPEGIRAGFEGNARDFGTTSARQPLLILGALIAVYIVLGVLYESLLHPLTIISTLPSAGLGALMALQLTNTPLTVIAFIGIILLIGIVKKNGIMIVDFALEGERKHGLDPATAIFEASIVRFRPILMTTLAALLAAVPLVDCDGAGHGAAASARHHDHRRADRVADPHALHDAGDLSADGPAETAAGRAADRARGACGIGRRGTGGNLFVPLAFSRHERPSQAAARHRKRRKTSRSAAGNRRGRGSPEDEDEQESLEQVRRRYLLGRFWLSAKGFWGRHGSSWAGR